MLVLGGRAQNAACNAVVAQVDAADAPGALRIMSPDGTVLCEIALAKPAFAEAVDGVALARGLPLSGTGTAAAAKGTRPTKYDVVDGAGEVAWSGDIPGNLTLDNTSIAQGQTVSILSWAHMQPAK